MIPYFNTAGPCIPGRHYMVPPERRLKRIMRLVDEDKYFTVHAGRQTGKTTSARWLVDWLNKGDQYLAVWVDIQTAREQPDPARAFRTILNELARAITRDLPDLVVPYVPETLLADPSTSILYALQHLSMQAPRPVVVFFDEADGLVGPTMVLFLTQLRAGYIDRSRTPFPASLALIGMRQVRDYVVNSEKRHEVAWLGTSSPFNITAEASTLDAFSYDDVVELLEQHTQCTGQVFLPEATKSIYALSRGHPWLVNAIADQIVNRDEEDRRVAIAARHVEIAKETLITERRTHIDSLLARLREPRVQAIIEPMIMGRQTEEDVLNDDFAYALGLGLIVERDGRFQIANPIYREVIPRALTYIRQRQIPHETAWYVRDDGNLNMPGLMAAWQKFWRKDGHLAAQGFLYREAGPHLMIMAFLQRIVNGGGRVEREYGLGRGALDLMIFFGGKKYVVEIKLRRDTETRADALEQVAGYLDSVGLEEGWLVLFDLRKSTSWEEKLFTEDEKIAGKCIHITGS